MLLVSCLLFVVSGVKRAGICGFKLGLDELLRGAELEWTLQCIGW